MCSSIKNKTTNAKSVISLYTVYLIIFTAALTCMHHFSVVAGLNGENFSDLLSC